MFAVAARFTEVDKASDDDKMWEAGCEYLDSARKILSKIIPSDSGLSPLFNSPSAQVFHISRPSTVQALLLLGYREFGIGSMEQGWIFIGKISALSALQAFHIFQERAFEWSGTFLGYLGRI